MASSEYTKNKEKKPDIAISDQETIQDLLLDILKELEKLNAK